MIFDEESYLKHYGTLRKSGRYPWGSGSTQHARNKTFLAMVADLERQGLGQKEVVEGLGLESTTQLRALKSIAKAELKAADIAFAQRLADKGVSNGEIGKKFDPPKNESSVRALLAPAAADKIVQLTSTSEMLKRQVDERGYIDIGTGVENHLGVSKERLGTSLAMLKEQGYEIHSVQVDQLGTAGNKTTVKVLAPPGTTYRDVAMNTNLIKSITEVSDDGGRSFFGLLPPKVVDSSRVEIAYKEDGGDLADGVMYVRPGVEDLSLGGGRYAQVRVMVGENGGPGTHYLKGMAIYKDDLPDGVDILFNTNKAKADIGTNKLDALKAVKDDPDNPFGAVVDQIKGRLPDGTEYVTSAMNVVNTEGRWGEWSKSLSSQFLSKQSTRLAQERLGESFRQRREDLDEILSLTNPAVKKKLLEEYADSADAASVHLKAAAMPRQATQVILPVPTLKPTDVYAPNFRNGERVVLVRFPHGGTFEIPELTVNNNHPDAKSLLGQAADAIGIHPATAARLSGADFDGDTVLVIPNNSNNVKTSPALEGLKGFDPQRAYPAYDGMPQMSAKTKGTQMGLVSNLITDMTIQGASNDELARAVRHSMVVIDAEKHHLNYKESARVNGITALQRKYQPRDDGRAGGAATLISRASSRVDVKARKRFSLDRDTDPETGEKVYRETGENWVDPKTGKTIYRMQRSEKLAETKDANTLSSGTRIEEVYATHSNRLKALANEARKTAVAVRTEKQNQSAKEVFKPEVSSLDAKLNIALKNRPLERQAQVLANATVAQKKASNPGMDHAEIKKLEAQALAEARTRTGAKKQQIVIDDREWDAIQAGAISNNKLTNILQNADMERVRTLATPRQVLSLPSARLARATSLLNSGLTQAEVAQILGVSLTTLKTGLKEGPSD